jgi:hypothetical protein
LLVNHAWFHRAPCGVGATEEKKGKAEGIDFTGAGKAWKESYLGGLEAGVKFQEQAEGVAKGLAKQSLTATQQWITQCNNWVDLSLNQASGQANPMALFSKQMVQAWQTVANPAIRSGVDACEAAIISYETSVAAPSRKYVLEINKRIVDSIIPS